MATKTNMLILWRHRPHDLWQVRYSATAATEGLRKLGHQAWLRQWFERRGRRVDEGQYMAVEETAVVTADLEVRWT